VDTVWILGDQLNRSAGALRGAKPGDVRVLLVESQAKLRSKPWHRQRLHLVLTASTKGSRSTTGRRQRWRPAWPSTGAGTGRSG
jgi:deoxyribodipyrimidine photolyase-like uncharacterized protein